MERNTSPHVQFDEICEPLDEFEPLPAVVTPEMELAQDEFGDEDREPLDGLILAGLVSP